MEKFWNIIYYFIYMAYYQLFLFSNKIDPLCYFIKLPIVKRHLAKKNIDIMQKMDYAYKRRDYGISITHTGGIMISLFFFYSIGILSVIFMMLEIHNSLNWAFIFSAILSFFTSYFALFKDDKYIAYFKKCDKMSKADKIKWAFITLVVVIFSILSLIASIVL